MKKFSTLFVILLGFLIVQSCSSDDDNSPKLQETEIFIDARNATIKSIEVKADGKTIYTSTGVESEQNFSLKVGYPQTIYIRTTAIVDKDNIKADLRYGTVIGGDGLSTAASIEKEKPTKGEILELGGKMTFSHD